MSEALSNQHSRLEITEVLALYCRSLDRMDRDLMSAVFHPGAIVRYPKFEGTWRDFVDWVWVVHEAYETHSHQMSNLIIGFDADGRSAVSESYVSASFWKSADGLPTATFTAAADGPGGALTQTSGTQTEVRARYLDEWSLADGRWAIDRRVCVVDMKTEVMAVGLVGAGRRDTHDPSYAVGVTGHVLPKAGVSA